MPATATQTAVWADIDNDGYLDLFVGNESGPGQLFRNKGDGTFEDISHAAGVDQCRFQQRRSWRRTTTTTDIVDFYVSNLSGDNFLYHNNHDRTFTEVALPGRRAEAVSEFRHMVLRLRQRWLARSFRHQLLLRCDETMRTYLGLPPNAETMKLYKNHGNGTFRDVTAEVGLDKVFMPMGANFGDIDNDGFLDIYLGTGNPSYASSSSECAAAQPRGKIFCGCHGLVRHRRIAQRTWRRVRRHWNNGDEDILAEIGGAVPGDSHAFRLFKNPGNGNDWINLRLVGVKTNRAAIGARIKVTVQEQGKPKRPIYRTVGSGGSFGASPLQQHIGLGKSAQILDIEIWWPVSNTRQHFADVAPDQFLEIKEFDKNYKKLERKSFELGGRKPNADAAHNSTPQTPSTNSH